MELTPLVWGQENYWYTYHIRRDSSKIPAAWAVPGGTSIDEVRLALAALIRRHESLRTTFPLDDHGCPGQLVHPPGAVELPTWTEPDTAKALARLATAPMDPRVDRPVRAALTLRNGTPHRLVLVFNHIAVDGASIEILWREFNRILDGVPLDPPPRQPRDVAAAEQTSGQQVRHHSAIGHLDRCFAVAPRALFPRFRPVAPGEPAYRKASVRSEQVHAAVERIAARHRALPSMVYLAVYASLLAVLSGNRSIVVHVAFTNRQPELSTTVGCFFQRGVAAVSLPDELPLDDALRRIRTSYVAAWEHARYSYWRMRETRTRRAVQRGVEPRVAVSYNYYPSEILTKAWHVDPPPVPVENLWWRDPGKHDNETDVHFDVLLDRTVAELSVLAHRSVCDEHQIASLLNGIVRLLARWSDNPEFGRSGLAAAAGEYGITPPTYDSRWRYIDNSWICLPALAAVLESAPGIQSAGVSVTEAGTLVAHVADPGGAQTANGLRAHVLAAMADRFDIIPPHRYVLSRPGGTVVGDGKPADVRPPRTVREIALADAVLGLNPDLTADTARCYAEMGGRFARVMAIVDDLRRADYRGLSPSDLMGSLPLSVVASRLHGPG